MKLISLSILFLGLFFQTGLSQESPSGPVVLPSPINLELKDLGSEMLLLNQGWKFHSGDNAAWSDPEFDDNDWEEVDPTTDIHYLTQLREAEIGWFRLHLKVGSALLHIPLAMSIFQRGASEIYLNGKLIHKLGVVSQNAEEEVIYNPNYTPISFQFSGAREQVLAVRYSYTKINPYWDFLGLWDINPTLIIQISQMDAAIPFLVNSYYYITTRLVGKAIFLFLLALLHFFFYVTYPVKRTNLYYSLFTLCLAFGYFLEFVFRNLPREGQSYFILGMICSLFFAQFIIWGLLAVYSHAQQKPGRFFWFVVFCSLIFIVMWKWPYEAAYYYFAFWILIGPVDAIRVSLLAIRNKIAGAWVIFASWLGYFVFWALFCLFFYDILPRFQQDIAITLDLAIFCAAVTFSVVLVIEFAQTKRSLQASLLEVEVKRLEAEKMQEMDKTKSEFFANISHEFRTPLTLISGTVERLKNLDKALNGEKQEYDLIQRNAERLQQLINQLLDLSKIESGKLEVEQQAGEIISYLRRWTGSFVSLFESKGIDYLVSLPSEPLYVRFDPDKVEKILSNLLLNAFKFTSTGGKVCLKVTITKEDAGTVQLQILIEDTGVGIVPEKVPHIFERFYQADASASRSYEGTGIGLALAKELTELMGGIITVDSKLGVGSSFWVSLPMEMTQPEKECQGLLPENGSPTEWANRLENNFKTDDYASTNNQLPTILVIEDHAELRHFIVQGLKEQYQLMEAEDGLKGHEKAMDIMPALVISDVMMPIMDGVSLCKNLKTDERTSHIPIILLTARADMKSKLDGLETGADDYLTKPFKMEELRVRVRNLIEGRKKLREKYSRSLSLEPSDVAVNSTDEKFLYKVLKIMESNLSNPELDVEIFCREIGMSRTHLHRKLKALTGQSTSEFIRSFRLKKAASLLKQHAGNISEIAYDVGFNSLTYFTRCFKKEYGKKPSEFV